MERCIRIQAKDLMDLLIHYNQGRTLPLYCEVKGIGLHAQFPRMVGLVIEAKEWGADAGDISPVTGELKPLEFLYEGKHNMTFTSGHGDEMKWHETPQK